MSQWSGIGSSSKWTALHPRATGPSHSSSHQDAFEESCIFCLVVTWEETTLCSDIYVPRKRLKSEPANNSWYLKIILINVYDKEIWIVRAEMISDTMASIMDIPRIPKSPWRRKTVGKTFEIIWMMTSPLLFSDRLHGSFTNRPRTFPGVYYHIKSNEKESTEFRV